MHHPHAVHESMDFTLDTLKVNNVNVSYAQCRCDYTRQTSTMSGCTGRRKHRLLR